jgi:two-component system cell cycle sensor histidine kinase/response regulator CckA
MSSRGADVEDDALRREVVELRVRVAELQRAAARYEEADQGSLAEREELLREAERVAHLGTWTWEPASGRVTWSDQMYRILGIQPGSVAPSVETFFAAIHPEDRARAQEATAKSLREGVLPPVDCRIVRPDGSIRHTTSTSSMLFDAAGVPRRIVGAVLDRTVSLAVEAKLRHTLGLLEEAQHLAKIGSWRLVPQTGELEWSKEFRRIAAIPPDAPPDLALFWQRVMPEDRAFALAEHQRFVESGERSDVSWRLRLPDGQTRHVRVGGFKFADADGSTELRGTMLDVTDDVRLREQLAHSQKMEAVGRLAGGIAHDFNNLLTVVMGNLQLLARHVGPRPELDRSLQALTSATNLTRRLLTFGQKAHLSLKRVAPNELVQATATMMHRLVGDEVRIELELGSELPAVQIDPIEIERALVNLVVNARDAMPDGGVVRVGTALRKTDDGLWVELSVADQGIGISEADRPHIFEPFFTTRGGSGGTGLGLATVLGTAEQHGGTVRVEPRSHGGSIFTIVLPAAETTVTDQPPQASADLPGARVASGPFQLLVVDDQPDVASVTRALLETHGHRVRVAHNAQAALAIWGEHGAAIDLVICDVAMADMRGPELVDRMARSGVRPRVLFITGYSEEATRAELSHPVLAKPISMQALIHAVSEHAHRR